MTEQPNPEGATLQLKKAGLYVLLHFWGILEMLLAK